jgi:hypothetical protein
MLRTRISARAITKKLRCIIDIGLVESYLGTLLGTRDETSFGVHGFLIAIAHYERGIWRFLFSRGVMGSRSFRESMAFCSL